MMSWGFGGNWGKRSTITLRGGGGKILPGMMIFLCGINDGGFGGRSRIVIGGSSSGSAGFCVM
jgi:hypothetical protein